MRGRQNAQADAAKADAELAREQAEEIRLERQRRLHGWSPHGVDTFAIALLTTPGEMDQAREELASGDPTSYVIMRVAASGIPKAPHKVPVPRASRPWRPAGSG